MGNIACPLCGAPVKHRRFFTQGKPFCTHCGWNLQRAENSLNETARVPLFVFVVFVIMAIGMFWLFSSTGRNSRPFPAFAVFAIFALAGGLPLCGYFFLKRSIALAKSVPQMQGVQAQPIPDAFLQRIQSLPRPRRVGFRFPGALAVVAAFAITVLFGILVFAMTSAKRPAVPRGTAPFPYFVLFVPATFIVLVLGIVLVPAVLKEKRNRPLFQDGEVAAARVLAQRTVVQGRTSYSQIDYEFRASDGQTIRNSERDLTRKVFEDMLIPVFYDPVKPARCAALCASYSRLLDAEG